VGGVFFLETKTQFYKSSVAAGVLLKTVQTDYQSMVAKKNSPFGIGQTVVPIRTTTIWPNGQQSKTEQDYDGGFTSYDTLYDPSGNWAGGTCNSCGGSLYGQVITTREYDLGSSAPGPLMRTTSTPHLAFSNPTYLANNLLGLLSSTAITDAANATAESTVFGYDEASSTLVASGIATQHDLNPPAGSARGNLTSAARWLNTTGGSLVSRSNWFDTGELYQTIDPLGHTLTHSHDPYYAGGYLTKTCNPIGQCVSATYDLNSGLMTSFTDQNASYQASGNTQGDPAHTTSYSYDSMSRMTLAQAPPDTGNGGAHPNTQFIYSLPNAFPYTVQKLRTITSALNESVTTTYDGLSRPTKTQRATPNGVATIDSAYDGLNRIISVTNPYFSTSDPTYGVTTSTYDAFDRVTTITRQDGSIFQSQYSDPTTTITTDESGRQRRKINDGLGRLVEVDEPSAATVQVTYNATMQTDGNFVLSNAAGTSMWSTGTSGTNASSIFMQDDGNLVLYIFKWSAGTYATPTPGSYPAQTCSIGTYLVVNQRINANQCIVSPHGQYMLYMAPDGNFYIYDIAHAVGTWGANTAGHPGAYAILQGDGNFCIYDANNVFLWMSGTNGTFAERLDMEDDGRIIIYKSAWNSGTSTGQFNWTNISHPGCDVGIGTGWTGVLGSGQCFVSPNGRFELLIQTDGNMVIYDRSVTPNAAVWSSGTTLSPIDPSIDMRTLYTYDALGNLTCVEQHGTAATGTGCSATPSSDATSPWRVRRFTYDSLSRLLTAKNPESGTITYTYDADGELLQKTSPAPNQTGSATQIVSYCYDALHRQTKRDYSAHTYAPPACPITTPIISYTYDSGTNAKGHLTSLTDQAGTATYGYDVLGRLTTETRTLTGANNAAISKTFSYSYNLDGSIKTLTYPSGKVITYSPDSAGRMLSAVDGGSGINYVTGATYGPDSALTGFVSGSGGAAAITNSFSYNKRLQPVNMSASTTSQTVFSIGYDFHTGNGASGTDNGNVWGITNYKDTTRNQTFTYDALNRLTSAQNAGTDCAVNVLGSKKKFWGNSYGYDAWGNLLSKTVTKCSAESLSVIAGNNNWLTGAYLYDAAGNMTHDATSGLNYTFDQENRLTGANGYTYTYDGDGNRVRKSNGNLAANGTLYWAMTPGVVAETDLAGAIKSEYIFFDGERVARRDGPTGTGGVFYYFSDHLKTASVITDSAGVIKAESDYYPWGGELQFVNNDSNDYKFTGKKRDIETGLDYFGARYYSSGLGRWTSSDPFNPILHAENTTEFHEYLEQPQNWNRYTYVWNTPLRLVDPVGEDVYVVTYTVGNSSGDAEFKRAAETRASEIEHQKGFDPKKDTVLVRGVGTKGDFNAALKEANGMEKQFGKVGEVDLFSHSGPAEGPVLHDEHGKGVQFTQSELSGLKVNWAAGAQARFYGCNSANFAQAFANAQRVPSYGYTKWADFSSDRFWRVGPNPTGPLYLEPGEGLHNGGWWYIGSNRKMDPTMQRKDPLATPKKTP
jgi:RHS repeat-associated protein